MKYYESNSKKRGGTALYILIACGLIAIGVFAWFAVSRQVKRNDTDNSSVITPSDNVSYNSGSSSYNDYNSKNNNSSVMPNTASSGVANSVSDVPYSSEEQTAQPDAEPEQAPIMPIDGEILKDHSDSALQYSATFDDLRLHTGIDIAAAAGTAVKAAADGTVTATDESASLGKTVTIDHGNGIIIKYCGLDNVTVSVGKKVNMGDPIAVVGSIPAECADKSHLHLEATKNGETVSPMDIIGQLPE